jgi:hypothetical protein
MANVTTFSKRFGDDHFTINRVTYQTIGTGGFSRLKHRERHDYYINGKRTQRAVWFARKREAQMTDQELATESAEKAERNARHDALIAELLSR